MGGQKELVEPGHLQYKPDFPECAQRMTAFWRGEPLDRPPIWVTAPRRRPLSGPPAPPDPGDPVRRWTDARWRLLAADAAMRATFYGGEAVPAFVPQLGPGSLAIHLGSEPVFMPDTVWYEPCLQSLTGGPDLRHDEHEPWWVFTREMVLRARQMGEGKFVLAFPDLIENLDTLASLRGAQELLVDLIDAPEAVHRYQHHILELYFLYYDELAALMDIPAKGSLFVTFPGWGPGRVCKLQCDLSAMISPRMFREFVLPYLCAQCRRVDHAFYHLDGPDAICHLEALLEIPELHGIQWTPGAGTEPVESEVWWPLYRRTQEAGKSLFLLGIPAGLVPTFVRRFDHNLLFISTGCATQDEAEALLAAL